MDKSGNQKSLAVGRACAAGGAGVVLFLLLLLVFSFCSTRMNALQGHAELYGRLLLFAASLVSAMAAVRWQRGDPWLAAAACAGVFLVFLIAAALLSAHSSVVNRPMLLNLASVLCGGVLACLLSTARKRNSAARRRRSRGKKRGLRALSAR